LEGHLKRHANLLGIANKVLFYGFREDASELIAEMDIFVLSSLHEGIPFALLEAMSFSKPVVCTEVGGIKEVIQHEVDGLLVPAGNPQALSQAILKLLGNPAYAAELGRAARRKIETGFSSELMAKKTKALYSQLLEKASER
jgi:glycosyltransferase involved in cell wall biosynthesis